MPRPAPDPLRAQALTAADAAGAASRWFRRPDAAALRAARTARLRAGTWREAAKAVLRGGRGPAKTDAADLSFALREAVEHAVQAVSDAAQWDVGADEGFADMAEGLRDAARALARAAAATGEERLSALVEAKRLAAVVEVRRRAARAAAHESPFFVDSVKRSEIAARLSASAEALQQAADALAGSLAE
jgi:hypothetical protein